MAMIEKREKFKKKIEATKDQYFPNGTLEVLNERVNFLKIRISFREKLFMDIYYNSVNNRTDYALIKDKKRIFGCDNVGEWHIHPFESPEEHRKCDEPTVEEIFERIKKIIEEL